MSIYSYDSSELDVALLDGEASVPVIPTDEIWYNYYGLANAAIVTEFVKVSAPDWNIGTRSFPRADGAYRETAFFQTNRIKLRGVIKRTTRTSLELEMDNMREAFAKEGALLKITWAGVTRFYENCYAMSINTLFDSREHYHVTFVPWEIEFTSLQPFARSQNRDVFDAPYALTSTETTYALDNTGTAPTDPMVFLTLGTVGTCTSITWENTDNMESLVITGTFTNGDLFVIDGENKTVKKNSVPIDYSGVIPKMTAGLNNMKVTFNGGGFSASLTEQHYQRFY
jgi:hypothetical protein